MRGLASSHPHLSAHIAAGHIRKDGLQHDLHGSGLLAQRGQDSEEAVPNRDGIQAAMEVLMLGKVEAAGTWKQSIMGFKERATKKATKSHFHATLSQIVIVVLVHIKKEKKKKTQIYKGPVVL